MMNIISQETQARNVGKKYRIPMEPLLYKGQLMSVSKVRKKEDFKRWARYESSRLLDSLSIASQIKIDKTPILLAREYKEKGVIENFEVFKKILQQRVKELNESGYSCSERYSIEGSAVKVNISIE